MSKQLKYRVIEQKLEQMPGGPDVDGLWMDMRSRLDHHMPEEQEKRRMLWWWKKSGIFLMAPLAIFVAAVFFTILVTDKNDQSQDVATQTDITSGVTIYEDVANITSDNETVAPSDNSLKSPAASSKEQRPSAPVRTAGAQQNATKKFNNTTPASQTGIQAPGMSTAIATAAGTAASDASATSAEYEASLNVGAIMRQGLNTGRPTMNKGLVLLPVPTARTNGFLFLDQTMQAQAAPVQTIERADGISINAAYMRKALNADYAATQRNFVLLPVPTARTTGFLFVDPAAQQQVTVQQIIEPASASINVAGIMRQGLNAEQASKQNYLVMLPVPKPGTTGPLFLNHPVQPQATAYKAVPALPATSKADAGMKPGYPSLTLSPSLIASPVVLQQREFVGAVTDTMTFPAAAMWQNRFAFSKKFVVGAAVHMNLPVSSQEMSTVSMNGGNNKLFDYMPSVYGQYHFAPKFFVQSEFQFITPQHTPKLTLSSTTTEIGPSRKQVQSIVLNKFYYMNLPVSLHYKVLPNLYTGVGIQYSYLTRSMLMEENSTWQNGTDGWEMKTSNAKLHVKKNPKKEKEKFKTPTDPTNPGPRPVPTSVDVVAQKFKSNDWRFTYDLNYYRRRFNAGIRMNIGINNYIDTEVSGTNVPVRDRNKSFQLYVRYNIWQRKKS